MEARTVNNPPPAAPHDDAVRCVLAIELSKKSWIVAVNTPSSEKISRYTLKACDWMSNRIQLRPPFAANADPLQVARVTPLTEPRPASRSFT
jgi:hypothetical protein